MTIRIPRLLTAVAGILAMGLAACNEPATSRIASPAPGAVAMATSSSPTLLECPTTESQTTSGVIGVLGGTLSLGGTTVNIPAGALAAPQLFVMSLPAGREMEVDVTAVGFDHFLFQTPITVTVDYSRCNRSDIDSTPLSAWHVDELTKALLENMGGVDDKIRRTVTFQTPHLSGYAIAN